MRGGAGADLEVLAADIIASNNYLTLGTANRNGTPWVSPVFFATADHHDFYWISSPDAAHSRNIADRPQISMVIFDSTVPLFSGQAVYMSAMAEELTDADELTRGLEVYPGPAERGAKTVGIEQVRGAGTYRLYRARVVERFVLCPGDPGGGCKEHGSATDHRAAIPLAVQIRP